VKHLALLGQTRGLGTDRHLGRALYKTARWQRVREQVLSRFPTCQCSDCSRLKRVRVSRVVHHLRHHRGNEQRFFNMSNLQAVSKECHDRITAEERRSK